MSKTGEPVASASLLRVLADARRHVLAIGAVHLPDGTRTAVDAARACGCAVDQIIKAIVFRVVGTDHLVLFLTAGGSRVDLVKAGALVGATLEKADAASIRAATGFAIGGVSPLGHLNEIETWLDPHLLDIPMIWAAAGTPNHAFQADPSAITATLKARVADFTEERTNKS
jgi:prolyl-tRNA editing enzyme YbaK/EbsC (Cys-tRNA(Pro) deacylase)